MGGELSKLVGEIGEETAFRFLERIGWANGVRKKDIPCNSKTRHKNRESHGIDYAKSYMCPLIQLRIVHNVVSIKFSSNPYPKYPNSKLKEHIEEISETIHCFNRSDLKNEVTQSTNRPNGFEKEDVVGVLIWLTNSRDSYQDLINETQGLKYDDELNFQFDALYLVDNRRVEFIWKVLNHADKCFPDWEFLYPNTGLNYSQEIKHYSGKLLPVEYINSSVIVMRESTNGKENLLLYILDKFDGDDLKKLIGLTSALSNTFASEVIIAYDDYNRLQHDNEVQKALNLFSDVKTISKIQVVNFNDNLIQ